MSRHQTHDSKRVAVVTYLFRQGTEAQELLLMRRTTRRFNGKWFPVEGLVDSGEATEEAALREVREETSLTVERLYREQVEPMLFRSEVFIYIFVGFVAPSADVILNPEHDAYEWLSPVLALQRLSLPEQQATLRRIQTRFLDALPPEHLRVI